MSESSTPSSELVRAPSGREPSSARRASLVDRSLQSLDWPGVIEALAERAATRMGEELCWGLPLLESPKEAEEALAEVAEMLALMEQSCAPSVGGVTDVREAVAAVSKGAILEGPDLLSIAHSLEALERLKRQTTDQAAQAPLLYRRSVGIEAHPDLAAWLIGSFDPRGELSASTYPQLSGLRSAKARLHTQIRGTLDTLRGQQRFGEALQDDFVALRNDRYVVPLKASEKRQGFGIVHDTSGSGQTVFVEPLEIVEMNNDLKMADAELRQEEHRILRDLSERVALIAWDMGQSLTAAAALDLVLSKAKLGQDLGATVFTLSATPGMKLRAARHPILVLQGEEVVPNDLELGEGRRALVLSGPNTGGKTISLKTLGLAALFARAALPFPADEGSEIGWFTGVLTDIGDAQDVREGLSTFSGHLLSLIEIFDSLRGGSGGALVLIDEIAVGTDPVQGAALGRAVLESLLSAGVLLATTTHYPELKALAATDPRFVNARVEFDEREGAPTFRVSVGRPGSSHALDIAARVGLGEPILKLAREFLDRTSADVEQLLSGLESELEQAREARAAALMDRAQAVEELETARADRAALEQRTAVLKKDLRVEFEREVRGYRDSVRGAMKQLKERDDAASIERARQRINEGAAAVRDRLGDDLPGRTGAQMDPGQLQVGDPVRVVTLGKDGVVAELPDRQDRVFVEAGGIRLRVLVSDLQPVRTTGASSKSGSRGGKKGSEAAKKKGSGRPTPTHRPEPDGSRGGCAGAFRSIDNTLNLRGERVEEACERLERFLDAAYLRDWPYGFVLHGHGTGALKAAVRSALRRSSYVQSWEPGTRSQGGEGITVVELKSS